MNVSLVPVSGLVLSLPCQLQSKCCSGWLPRVGRLCAWGRCVFSWCVKRRSGVRCQFWSVGCWSRCVRGSFHCVRSCRRWQWWFVGVVPCFSVSGGAVAFVFQFALFLRFRLWVVGFTGFCSRFRCVLPRFFGVASCAGGVGFVARSWLSRLVWLFGCARFPGSGAAVIVLALRLRSGLTVSEVEPLVFFGVALPQQKRRGALRAPPLLKINRCTLMTLLLK